MVKVDNNTKRDVTAIIGCAVMTGAGAVENTAGVKAVESVVIFGVGGVGLSAVVAAKAVGANPIIAVDLDDAKLAFARQFGATHTINSTTQDASAEIMQLTANRGVDYVFVTVGAKAALDAASQYITKNGAVVVVGMPPTGVMAAYDPGTLAAWNQRILGSKMGETIISRDIPRLVQAYQQGELMLDELVSNTFSLANINTAIAEVKAGSVRRNVIVFD